MNVAECKRDDNADSAVIANSAGIGGCEKASQRMEKRLEVKS
jgi:hypothetical protein